MIGRIGDLMPPVPGAGGEPPAGRTAGDKGFAEFVREATAEAVDTMKQGEAMSQKGIAGEADLNDVVSAVNDAEMTLQTVTALRDKVVQAYQEIIRMPI